MLRHSKHDFITNITFITLREPQSDNLSLNDIRPGLLTSHQTKQVSGYQVMHCN